MIGDTVVYTNNVFFMCICRNREAFSEIFVLKLGIVCNTMLRYKIEKMNLKKKQIFELQRLSLTMEITYIYGNVVVIHCESIELVGIFQKWEYSHKRRSYLIKLAINTSLIFPENNINSFFKNKVVLLLLTSPNNKIESEMPRNTTRTLDKLPCTNYVDFGKCQERFERFSWTKNDSNYLDDKLKMFKWEDKKADFQLSQNFSMGEADFNQFVQRRNQLDVAAQNFLREQNLSPVLQSTLSKDMEDQLTLGHKVIDVVDSPNRRICVTLLRNKADNPETSYAQVRFFGLKKEDEEFQQIGYLNHKIDDFVYLFDVMNSV